MSGGFLLLAVVAVVVAIVLALFFCSPTESQTVATMAANAVWGRALRPGHRPRRARWWGVCPPAAHRSHIMHSHCSQTRRPRLQRRGRQVEEQGGVPGLTSKIKNMKTTTKKKQVDSDRPCRRRREGGRGPMRADACSIELFISGRGGSRP